MLTCTTCWELYKGNNGNLKNGDECPKEECEGHIATIDEMFLHSIVLLNEKGYRTRFCCSGHSLAGESDRAYIMFEETVKQKDLAPLPGGFTFETSAVEHVVIQKALSANDRFELHREAVETSIDVLEWARTLPALEATTRNQKG